jgi:predicted PurR-regulated permease PerM
MNRSLDAIILRYAGYASLFALAAFLLYMVRGALPIFFISGLLAYALEPVLKWLERRGRSRRSAVGYVFVVFLLLMGILASLLATAWQQTQGLVEQAPQYQQQITTMIRGAQHKLEGARLPVNLKHAITDGIADFQSHVPEIISGKTQAAVAWLIPSVGWLMVSLIVVPIVTLWLMVEMNPLRARILILIPAQYRRDVAMIATHINELLGRYVRGQMIVCSLYGVLCTIAFYVLNFLYGMEYPLVLGVLAALIYIVPYLGMATIATSAGLTAYFTSTAPIPCAIIAVASCLLFNLVIDYGITPRIIGKGVGLHPLMVIFALLAGAQVGGVFGMVLSIPVFASLRVIAIYLFPQLTAPIPETPPENLQPEGATTGEKSSEILKEANRLDDPPPANVDPAAVAGSR